MSRPDDVPRELTKLFEGEYRKELAEYYRWIVSLALFVLTVSISVAGFFPSGMRFKGWLLAGWVLLGLCVFFNWILLKRLVGLPIVVATPAEDRTFVHQIFLATFGSMRRYGLLQNLTFVAGVLCVGVGFILNIWLPAEAP